ENTGSWIIKVILGLIVIVFIFLGMGSMQSNRANSVAMVNETPITMDEYNRSYQNMLEQIRQQFGNNLNDELIKMLQVKKQAMDRLIEERLIADEADRLDIQVSDKELQDSLLEIEAFKKNGIFDLQTYRRVLTANRLIPDTFETMQRQTLRRAKVADLVLNSIKVSDFEAREWYIQNNSEVAVDYVKFDPASYPITPDDAQIKEYYEKNKGTYQSEPQLKVQYLVFSPDEYKEKAEVTTDDIASYFSSNPDEFTTPEQVEASHILIRVDEDAEEDAVEQARKESEEIYKKIIAGEDFSQLAKTYSQDPSAKNNGGYLGKFARNKMVKPFEEKAFSMKPGQVSEPIRTQFGWHVIQVKSKTEESKKSLEEAAPLIKEKILMDESRNLAYNAAGKAFDAVIDGDSLEQVALLTGKKVLEVGPFTMKGPDESTGSVFPNASEFARAAFNLPLNEISDVTEVGNAYYIIRPFEKKEPVVLSLDEAKEKLISGLKSELQAAQAKNRAEAFLTTVKNIDKFADVAKEQGLEVKSTPLFKKDGDIADLGREPEIASAAFKLSEKNRLVSEEVKAADGSYYIIVFKEKKIPGEDIITENLESVKKELLRTKQGQTYASWIEQLKSNSSIEIEPGIIDG
ncbi:MAG: SurA N-terminal domain-containing protein, partial [Desulfamplus sp.]|nr:SurA N-terminal domain-containing protein [Desulfamplus sp.]